MANWDISQAIADGFERGMDKIANKITESLATVFTKMGLVVLEGAETLIIILAVYYIFKFMLNLKKGKQEENVNVLVCLGGVYFIIKMIMVMMELGLGGI